MKITMAHARQHGRYCRRGVVQFFDKYGLDLPEFLANGIDEEKLVATGDSMAIRIVEKANGRK